MSQCAIEPVRAPGRAWAPLSLPWLFSTALHLALLVVLVAHFEFRQPLRDADLGQGAGETLTVTFAPSSGLDELPPAASTTLKPPTPAPAYYADEPAADAQPLPPRRFAASANRQASLTSLLDERPTTALDGVLPAAGPPTSQRTAGVETSRQLTGETPGARRVRGGTARTSVFGAVGEGRKFAYVFDRSGSMDGHGGAPLRAAKAELIASLNDLKSTHQFQILFYNEHPRVFNPTGVQGKLVFGTDQNKILAQKFVGSITADGATRHEEALETALKMVPDVIFFLTDADEPRMTSAQLARVARLNRGTVIHAIEFGYGPQADPDDFLVKLARQNGGSHVYVDVADLPGAQR
jgi:hypothetical protein